MLSLVSILWVFFSFFGALGLFENKTVGGLFWSESVPKGMRFLGCFDTTPKFLESRMKNLKNENNKQC